MKSQRKQFLEKNMLYRIYFVILQMFVNGERLVCIERFHYHIILEFKWGNLLWYYN